MLGIELMYRRRPSTISLLLLLVPVVFVPALASAQRTPNPDRAAVSELAPLEGLRYAHTAVEPVVRGSVARVAFRREISGTGRTAVEGRGTAVLEKVDAGWVIVHLHMSK